MYVYDTLDTGVWPFRRTGGSGPRRGGGRDTLAHSGRLCLCAQRAVPVVSCGPARRGQKNGQTMANERVFVLAFTLDARASRYQYVYNENEYQSTVE